MKIELEFVKSSDSRYQARLVDHYPQKLPDKLARNDKLGRVTKAGNYGQALHFIILVDGVDVGISSGGCAVYTVKSRDEFFGFPKGGKPGSPENMRRSDYVQAVCNHTQFVLDDGHGVKNLGSQVLKIWREACIDLWPQVYGVHLIGFETFVDPAQVRSPNPGYVYKVDGWQCVGETVGVTKQHIVKGGMTTSWADQEKDEETGSVLRRTSKKLVFCRKIEGAPEPAHYEGTWDVNKKIDGRYKHPEDVRARKLALLRQRSVSRETLLAQRFAI